jgi:hypothetical protein
LQRAVAGVARRAGADLNALWVIEGIGTYGARLARAAADAGYRLFSMNRGEAVVTRSPA